MAKQYTVTIEGQTGPEHRFASKRTAEKFARDVSYGRGARVWLDHDDGYTESIARFDGRGKRLVP